MSAPPQSYTARSEGEFSSLNSSAILRSSWPEILAQNDAGRLVGYSETGNPIVVVAKSQVHSLTPKEAHRSANWCNRKASNHSRLHRTRDCSQAAKCSHALVLPIGPDICWIAIRKALPQIVLP